VRVKRYPDVSAKGPNHRSPSVALRESVCCPKTYARITTNSNRNHTRAAFGFPCIINVGTPRPDPRLGPATGDRCFGSARYFNWLIFEESSTTSVSAPPVADPELNLEEMKEFVRDFFRGFRR